MVKKKVEKCGLCEGDIFLDTDDYVQVKDFRRGKFLMEGFYHIKCYLERINKGTKLNQLAGKLLNRTNQLLDRTGIPRTEEYEIV